MSTEIADDSRYLVEACSFMIERGFCGLVWLDADLMVCQRAGRLVDFIALGQPVGSAILPLFGSEDDIRALRLNPRHRVELANIRIVGNNTDSPRLNFYVHWLEASARYLIIIVRNTSQFELEAELENKSRRLRLAEAEAIEQSNARKIANDELMRANRLLEEYANIIAHDLKSPMRAVRYYVEDIEHALERKDNSTALELLGDLRQQARRMSRMLTDLLTYARIGPTDDDALQETDTRELAEAIIASLPRPRGFTIELTGIWPRMRTIEPALDVVIRNLIDNAIKHHDRADGRVTLLAAPVASGLELAIRDDGPGIEPRYHGAIFQPFRKLELKPATDPLSSGIGLSLVRKTVEANGARLDLESEPAIRRGTTFKLLWPGQIVA